MEKMLRFDRTMKLAHHSRSAVTAFLATAVNSLCGMPREFFRPSLQAPRYISTERADTQKNAGTGAGACVTSAGSNVKPADVALDQKL
ncbi:hypothetical protein [Xanthomonas dyei]|uniref:hypothetical protein n=1 Tax=Xanthomonas dyei TaxID=743699 RepID=UPI001EE999A2|nr:hypothetical protein [Xanthomonas dyei]